MRMGVVDDGTCLVLVLLDFFFFGLTLRLWPTKLLILLRLLLLILEEVGYEVIRDLSMGQP